MWWPHTPSTSLHPLQPNTQTVSALFHTAHYRLRTMNNESSQTPVAIFRHRRQAQFSARTVLAGTSPHHADNSRPLENCVASTSLRNAAAIREPTPEIVNRWRYAICCDDSAAISLSRLVIRSFNACISSRSEDNSRRRVHVRLFEASSISSGSCC